MCLYCTKLEPIFKINHNQEKWTRFCETKLRENDSQNRDLFFLKFGGDWFWVSAPQEGAGGMRGGGFGFFWRAGNTLEKILIK